jgi:DNA-binding NtrC family response regulator
MSASENRPLCLLVEDQALIGMSLEGYLEDVGCDVSEPLGSVAAALAWLEKHTPTVAILDFVLKDGSCAALAAELNRRQIPFIVYSGRSPAGAPDGLNDAPWIEKPADRAALLGLLASVSPEMRALMRKGYGAPEMASVSPSSR